MVQADGQRLAPVSLGSVLGVEPPRIDVLEFGLQAGRVEEITPAC
jgi:hypothetical protein